jgi:hypothetical protein
MSDAAAALIDGSAWRAFCRRLEAIGEKLQGEGYSADPRERAEGYRAITRWLTYAAQQEIEAGDPRFPGFVSLQNPWNQWGGPNPDNVYLRANVDPALAYRVWTRDARGLRQAIFSLHEGDMQLGEYGVFGERSLDQLPLAADGSLEIWLTPQASRSEPKASEDHRGGSAPRPGHCIELDPRARIFTIRLYQSDWERDALPIFQIERVDAEGVPRPPLDPGALAAALERTARWVEASVEYWNRYTSAGWSRATPNVAAPARSAPGGADNILYGSCFFELAPDQALLLEVERPDAQYWNFIHHTMPWLESGEFDRRFTSLSDQQVHVDADGVVRVVVAHRDPGTANWIDTEERRRGLLVYRWVWARNNPVPHARVLPPGAVRAALPPDHPTVSPDARRAQLARRREAVWNRYR